MTWDPDSLEGGLIYPAWGETSRWVLRYQLPAVAYCTKTDTTTERPFTEHDAAFRVPAWLVVTWGVFGMGDYGGRAAQVLRDDPELRAAAMSAFTLASYRGFRVLVQAELGRSEKE